MLFRLFSLHPEIFDSFWQTGLMARALSKNILQVETLNWRQDFGLGNYKQVDDRPFGGGSGMVLRPEPIFAALSQTQAVSPLFNKLSDFSQLSQNNQPNRASVHRRIFPPNRDFEQLWQAQKPTKVTISLTPRGFPLTQKTCQWLAENFQEINLLCGRYEGFDARVSEVVDLELSVGNFVLNGGEVGAMCLIEAVSRLLPDFVSKQTSVLHDSFSASLNSYQEQREFVVGKKKLAQKNAQKLIQETLLEKQKTEQTNNLEPVIKQELESEIKNSSLLFDNQWWSRQILPLIEHPQYTRPLEWSGLQAPPVLLSGDHKKIQSWRENWFSEE